MPANRNDLLSVTRALLRWGFYIDIGLLLLLVVVFIGAMLGDGSRINIQALKSFDSTLTPEQKLIAARVAIALALVCCALALPVLRHLRAIVESARSGDPFVPENGVRLRHVGWLMLAINIAATSAARGGFVFPPISFTGLLTVLMIFVLARIFETGSRMRADLRDTV